MDADGILNSTKDDLNKMGLEALGDINAVRNFAQKMTKKAQQEEKKSLLESLLRKPDSKRKYHEVSKPRKDGRRKESRKVSLGWLHYDVKAKKYISVRSADGGGMRDIDLDLTACASDVVAVGKDIFFSNGICNFGPADTMSFGIANFQQKDLTEINVSGTVHPFTLQRYLKATKFPKARLYITSKCDTTPTYEEVDTEESMHNDEVECASSIDSYELEHDTLFQSIRQIATNSGSAVSAVQLPSSELTNHVESIEERRMILKQQDKEYEESKRADQEKEKAKKEALLSEIKDAERQENLRVFRQKRTPEEPSKDEPEQINIQVRHVHMGLLQRAFRKEEEGSAVYNWIGSLSLLPEHFTLREYGGETLEPSAPISSVTSVLYMSESLYTPQVEDDVNFRGFGPNPDDSACTLSPYGNMLDLTNDDTMGADVSAVSPHLPHQLLDEDKSEDEESEGDEDTSVFSRITPPSHERGRYFRQIQLPQMLNSCQSKKPTLEQQRLKIVKSMEEHGVSCKVIHVHRWNIVSEIMDLYSKDEEMGEVRIHFQLEGERGSDYGGVSRDVYATFWNEGCFQFCEGNENLFVPKHSGLAKEECITLGKIINHGFLMTGIFPIMLSQSYMQAMLLGEEAITDEFVLADFVNYLTAYESNTLQSILTSSKLEDDDRDFILDLEDRYGMRTFPTTSNVKSIAVQMARSELIDLPMHTMGKLKQGMMSSSHGKQLWKDISVEDINEVYRAQSPSPARVLSLLTTVSGGELTAEESKVYELLRRYVRSSDQKRCVQFLKYCTGSTTIVVQKLSVSFFKSNATEPLPKAHTCGAVLEMPCTGYSTFNFFKMMMDKLLDNPLAYEFRFE